MKGKIFITGVIGKDTTFLDVVKAFKQLDEPSEIEVIIHSNGGKVGQGDNIHDFLKGIDLVIPVTTVTDKAYSIAAKIFTAGRRRIVEDVENAIMIHNAWTETKGDSKKFRATAEALEELEEEFAEFYSAFLGLENETVKNLLENETTLSGAEAVELGFATEIKTASKAVALYDNENLNKNSDMSTKNKKKSPFFNAMKALLSKEANALILQDSNGTEIDFPDLEEGEVPVVGTAATVDGVQIEDGVYIMPSLDNASVTFVDGKITEIMPEEEEEEEEIDANAETVKEVSYWEREVVNTTFAVGDVVEYEYEGENFAVMAGEFKIADGRSVVTDASGVIVLIKDAETLEEDPSPDSDSESEEEVQALFAQFEEKISSKIEKNFNAKFDALKNKHQSEVERLKSKIGSKEFSAQQENDPTPNNTIEQKSMYSGLKKNKK